MRLLACALLLVLVGEAAPAAGVDQALMERKVTQLMEQYAIIIGRAKACGLRLGAQYEQVARWYVSQFPADDPRTLVRQVSINVELGEARQREGHYSDGCSAVRTGVPQVPWP